MIFKSKIFRRFLTAYLPVTLAPLIIISFTALWYGQVQIRDQTFRQLQIMVDGAEALVLDYLNYLKIRTSEYSASKNIIDALKRCYRHPGNNKSVRDLNRYLTYSLKYFPECIEMFVLDVNGRVIASSDASNTGKDLSETDYFLNGQKAVCVSDIFREEETGRITWLVSCPVRDIRGNRLLAVLVSRIDPVTLSDITTERKIRALGAKSQALRIGETGETYIVNRDKLMITESRFWDNVILKQAVDTEIVRRTIKEGETKAGNYPDYRGIPVDGASMVIQETGWIVISETDFEESVIPFQRLLTLCLTVIGALILIIICTSWLLSRRLTVPIMRLIKADRAVMQGEKANVYIPDHEMPADEMGEVMHTRNIMLTTLKEKEDELRKQQEELKQKINNLEQFRREIELLQTTTMAIAESEDLYSALVVVLQNVCNTTGWDYGEAWLPSPDGNQLQHGQAWYSSLADMEEFTNQSKKFTFPPGIGLPGSVWSSKKPQWRRSVNTDTGFLRAQLADKYGLKAAMGIPVLADKKVVAVLCFFLRQQKEEDERLLWLVSVTAAQLGSVIQRKQAGEALKKSMNGLEQYNREISLLSEMDSMLETCVTTQEAYTVIAGFAERLFPGDSGTLYIHNVTYHIMEAVVEWGILHKGERIFALDNCWALRRGQIFAADTSHAGLTCKHVDHSVKTCHLCLPITAQGEVLGLFYVQGNPDKPDMHESKQLLATTIAEHISLFLSNLKLREILRDQSIKDPLTGLFNRRYMLESLGRELHKAARNQSHLGIIMLDIDYFKRFNDTFGHEAGDTVLRELSAFLLSHIRGSDIACRYGGEEFVIVLPETTLENTTQRAGHIREKIKHLPMQHGGQPLGTISVSLGVAIYPDHGITSEALLRAADAALYRAKSEGRDRVVVWQQTNDKL